MKKGSNSLFATPETADEVFQYAEQHSTALPQPIRDYHAKVDSSHEDASMLSATLQSQLNVFLCRSIGAKRVLEIGVYAGFSAMVWSHAVGPGGQVVGLEYDAEFAKMARDALSGQGIKNVEIVEGDAAKTLPQLQPSVPFDVVFIDADKTGYMNYLNVLLDQSKPGSAKRLLRQGAVIIVDNSLQGSHVLDDAVLTRVTNGKYPSSSTRSSRNVRAMKEFNDKVIAHPRLEVFLVPLWDGATLIRLID